MNELFDMINGLNKDQHVRLRNPNLAPYGIYPSLDSERFKKFESHLDYLRNWKKEVEMTPNLDAQTKKSRLLPQQTQDAWELICLSYPAMMKFLLKEGTRYIIGRVPCQDPVEQHYADQRDKCGANRNVTENDYRHNENLLHITKKLAVKRKGANTETVAHDVDSTPLPKRPRKPVRRSIL